MLERAPIPVLVSGLGGASHGLQIVKALRAGSLRYRIIGCDMDPYCFGTAVVDHFEPVPAANDPAFLDAILDLCVRHRAAAAFHGCEPVMMAFARGRARFAEAGVYLPVNPDFVIRTCQDKNALAAFLAERGFPVPAYAKVRSIADAEAFEALPAVLKPSVRGGGSTNCFIAQTLTELRVLGEMLLAEYEEFTVQEYMGTADHEYTVGVLFGADGALLNSIAVRRYVHTGISTKMRVLNRTGRPELGRHLVISSGISQGEVGRFRLVTEQSEAIARALGPTAPVNLQLRLVDGVVYPFEINPRFSGTTSLRAMVGYNEPEVLIRREVLGETVEPGFPYAERLVLRGTWEMVVREITT